VLDLSWVVVGPTIAKALADHGAIVVKLESSARVDLLRRLPPFKDDQVGVNRSQFFANFNTGKRSVTLNFRTPGGRALARRLIDWADVVIESYTPGTMQKLGFDYATVSQAHPDLIMLSTSLLGQSGPYASFGGYGQQAQAFAGIHGITGWPDRPPCGAFGPYTDVIAPKFGLAALAAALHVRRESGLGQQIDLAQIEASIHMIAPLVLDESVNGRTAGPAGLDSATACPHGVYPVADGARSVAIAVETPLQWRALQALAPLGTFSAGRFDDLAARHAVRDQLDAALAAWCASQDPWALEARLAAAGIPAAVAQHPSDLHRDPQLAHRRFHRVLHHGEMGAMPYDAPATRFSARLDLLRGPAPCLGEQNTEVLCDLLGLSDDEVAEYAAQGAIE